MNVTDNVIAVSVTESKEVFVTKSELRADGVSRYISTEAFEIVSVDELERRHSRDFQRDHLKELWQCAVAYGNEERGLAEYIDAVFDDEDDGEEQYCGKEKFCESIFEQLGIREELDAAILDTLGIEVGTYDVRGYYRPESEVVWVKDFKKD